MVCSVYLMVCCRRKWSRIAAGQTLLPSLSDFRLPSHSCTTQQVKCCLTKTRNIDENVTGFSLSSEIYEHSAAFLFPTTFSEPYNGRKRGNLLSFSTAQLMYCRLRQSRLVQDLAFDAISTSCRDTTTTTHGLMLMCGKVAQTLEHTVTPLFREMKEAN